MFEQGVIRPPSEASSLLVRVTRNCPWNRCLICPAYKGTRFSRRTVAEVKADIDAMAAHYARHGHEITTAFLQDADSLILPTKDLLAVLTHLKDRFPRLKRVTSYARARTLRRKSVDDLKALKALGLTRIHTGMESGSQKVLDLIRKGSTPDDIVAGGQHVMQAGIELSEYIMPGVGGRTLSEEHARETARILNQIRPDFIRVRTFAMHPESPMQRMVTEGTFVPMTDEEIVAEIRLLLTDLEPMHSHFRSGDFSLNLLMQVDGFLDTDKDALLREVDRFLALAPDEKKAFALLHRSYPTYARPDEVVKDRDFMAKARLEIARLEGRDENGFHAYIRQLMSYQLPQPQTEDWS